MVRVFDNGPGDLGSIPDRVIPKNLKWYLMPPCLTLSIIKIQKMVLDSSLLNTRVRIKGKVEQSKERSSGLPYTSV